MVGFVSFIFKVFIVGVVWTVWNLPAEAYFQIYYVDNSSGNDSDTGVWDHPWQSTAAVNQRNFEAGDQILFRGTGVPYDPIVFSSLSHGDPNTDSAYIYIGSYWGWAVIQASSTDAGFYCDGCYDIFIQSLIFVGPGGASSAPGIHISNNSSGNYHPYIYLGDVEVTGFQRGIFVWSYGGGSSIDTISIWDVNAHDNTQSGIETWSDRTNGLTNVWVGYSNAYNNAGDPNANGPTGNGIVLAGVTGGTIEQNSAYHNGGSNNYGSGPVGIWAYYSDSITIQFNQAFENYTNDGIDGDGFDFDIGVTNSIMQYNTSWNNYGYGFLDYDPGYGNHDNTIRYNTSQNDNEVYGSGGIAALGGVYNISIYGNTVDGKQMSATKARKVHKH